MVPLVKFVLTSTMSIRLTQIPISEEVRTKLKAMKGLDSYDNYINRLMRVGNKQ